MLSLLKNNCYHRYHGQQAYTAKLVTKTNAWKKITYFFGEKSINKDSVAQS